MRRVLLLAATLLLAACPSPPAPDGPPAPPAASSAAPPSSATPATPMPLSTALPGTTAPAASTTVAPTATGPATTPTPSAHPSPGAFVQLSPAEEARLVTPHLAGRKLAHPAFRGPFGPPGDNVVALTATADAPPAELAGFVVLADGRMLPLPRLHDAWSLWEVDAILFEDVDGDGAKELIVVAEYVTGAGPEGAVPFHANAVVRWDGQAFVRMPAVEKRIERLPDAAAIRKMLRPAARGRSR